MDSQDHCCESCRGQSVSEGGRPGPGKLMDPGIRVSQNLHRTPLLRGTPGLLSCPVWATAIFPSPRLPLLPRDCASRVTGKASEKRGGASPWVPARVVAECCWITTLVTRRGVPSLCCLIPPCCRHSGPNGNGMGWQCVCCPLSVGQGTRGCQGCSHHRPLGQNSGLPS
jgi:hypothetical protein